MDNKERARQSIEGYLADPTDADLEWRQQHMELELNEAEARGREQALEWAKKAWADHGGKDEFLAELRRLSSTRLQRGE